MSADNSSYTKGNKVASESSIEMADANTNKPNNGHYTIAGAVADALTNVGSSEDATYDVGTQKTNGQSNGNSQKDQRVLRSAPSSAYDEVDGKKSETDLPAAYLSYLNEMQQAWPDLPELTITYDNFGYSVQVPKKRKDIPNLWSAFRDGMIGLNPLQLLGEKNPIPNKAAETVEFCPLQGASGVVRPGEMTLVLAPPGHGKSVLLKGLAGRLERESEHLRGEIRWNGLTAKESIKAGQQLAKLCAFVEQGDVHFPMLTVRETLQFALDNSNADVRPLQSPEFTKLQAKKVDLMLELLGLKECADTVLGNTMLRGVSGGQRKRVTLGEMMITQARALFLDEISTGLDAAATFDIVSALKKWTRVMRGSATVALLQPAPEVFDMFDNIILLREGVVVFSGTRAQLRAHFDAIHIEPNSDIDFADWLVQFLTAPAEVWKRDIENKGRQSSMRSFRKSFRERHPESAPGELPPDHKPETHPSKQVELAIKEESSSSSASPPGVVSTDGEEEVSRVKEVVFHLGSDNVAPSELHAVASVDVTSEAAPLVASSANGNRRKGLGQIITADGIPLTTSALRKSYEDSNVARDIKTEIQDVNFTWSKKQRPTPSKVTFAQYYQLQSWSLWHHTLTCLRRQWMFTTRSPEFIGPRIGQAIFMGLVIGSLYSSLGDGPNDFSPRLGLILFGLIQCAFANMAEVPLASEFKLVVWKQVDAGFYSTFSYVTSVVLMHFPLAIIETVCLGTLLYWIPNFVDDAGRYFFFILMLLFTNLSVGAMFRTVAYSARNPDIAQNLAGPITAICLLFGGFLITREKIPSWLIWVYYLSPFSWGTRSAGQNEFHSSRYDDLVAGTGQRRGDAYLDVWQIQNDPAWKWAGFGYLAGLFLFFVFMSAAALKFLRTWLTVGTRRTDAGEENVDDVKMEVRLGAKTTSMVQAQIAKQEEEDSRQLKFTPMDLSFIDLKYTVDVEETNEQSGKKEKYTRTLLAGINGYARAGELTALMGSSGAGKTTLMDVLAGRKTEGKISGKILVDGHPQEFPSFNRLMGYCQQEDIHLGTDTVREAIEFSARLRLPTSVSAETRQAFVDQILDDLELTPIANRLIGDKNIEGLSPGQLKLVTIGVELAANPTFLFLDEPTSGLDSRAALIVCRVIRKIARRGRSVICTIHQPSAELFYMFDRLLLLKSGGKESYFGPVGEDGVDLVSYFMNADIGPEYYRPKLPETVNPASWMLDVIGAGTSAKGKIAAYDEVYARSELKKQNLEVVNRLSTPNKERPPHKFDSIYAVSYLTQFYNVLWRLFAVYWRDVSYNTVKFLLMAIVGIVFGLVYQDINDDDEPGMISKLSVIYMGAGFTGVIQSANAIPVVFRLREVFYRERSSNMYAPWVYSSAMAIVELPYLFVCICLFVIPFYFLVGFENNVDLFFRYLLVMYLNSIIFCYMGQLLATLFPNVQVANIIQGVLFGFFFLFGGVFIQKSAMPEGWRWFWYIDPIPKALLPLAIQQFYCNDQFGDCPRIFTTTLGNREITKWEFTANYLATGVEWQAYFILYQVLTIFVVRLFVAFAVQKVSHLKR